MVSDHIFYLKFIGEKGTSAASGCPVFLAGLRKEMGLTVSLTFLGMTAAILIDGFFYSFAVGEGELRILDLTE